MAQPRRGSIGLVVVALPAWLLLSLLDVAYTPVAAKQYVPVDPYQSTLPRTTNDLKTGDLIPERTLNLLKGSTKIVVYASCPSCSIQEAKRAQRLATHPGVLVLDATGDNVYFPTIVRKLGAKNVLTVPEFVVSDFNVQFSPRYYEIDARGKVVYVQDRPDEDFEARLRP